MIEVLNARVNHRLKNSLPMHVPYMDPEVVGTTGMSSGADPRTQGMCNWGARARIIIVL